MPFESLRLHGSDGSQDVEPVHDATRPGRASQLSTAGLHALIQGAPDGIFVSDIEGMFQPFWQAGREDRRGAGLGLSICRSIVDAHGDSIWAEPATGMRVRVCFVLPCAGPAAFGIPADEPGRGA